jgi:hypothetical protein
VGAIPDYIGIDFSFPERLVNLAWIGSFQLQCWFQRKSAIGRERELNFDLEFDVRTNVRQVWDIRTHGGDVSAPVIATPYLIHIRCQLPAASH